MSIAKMKKVTIIGTKDKEAEILREIMKKGFLQIEDMSPLVDEEEYKGIFNEILDQIGLMPLPPYIHEELKEKDKLIILTSNDSNILYELTEELFIFNEDKLITSGNTFDIYTNVEILLENNVDVPYFSLLTYKANSEKGANLFYRKDVRDVIKDVYKSVS